MSSRLPCYNLWSVLSFQFTSGKRCSTQQLIMLRHHQYPFCEMLIILIFLRGKDIYYFEKTNYWGKIHKSRCSLLILTYNLSLPFPYSLATM